MCWVSRGCNITTKILAALKLVLPFYPIYIHCCHPGDDSSCCEHLPLAAYRFPGRKIAAPALSEEQREQRALPLHAPQDHLRAEVSTTDHSQAPLKTCCRPSTSGLKKKKDIFLLPYCTWGSHFQACVPSLNSIHRCKAFEPLVLADGALWQRL